MRPFKFRAWDKENKKMILPVKPAVATEFYPDGSWNIINWATHEDDEGTIVKSDNGEIMQFTGLQDKNGVDIYEGDIIRCSSMTNPGEVKWDNDGYWKVQGTGGYNFLGFTMIGTVNSIDGETYEVIGNVYENPELLEVKPDV